MNIKQKCIDCGNDFLVPEENLKSTNSFIAITNFLCSKCMTKAAIFSALALIPSEHNVYYNRKQPIEN